MNTKKRRMPAEWEPQTAVQLTWPHEHTDWAPMLPEITRVYDEMAHEISRRERLIVVDDIPHNDTWARDHGFITVVAVVALADKSLAHHVDDFIGTVTDYNLVFLNAIHLCNRINELRSIATRVQVQRICNFMERFHRLRGST